MRHHRTRILALLVILSGVVGTALWLKPSEPRREPAVVIVDSVGKQAELETALREGRVRLQTREEFDVRLTPEQRRLVDRSSSGPAIPRTPAPAGVK